MMISIESNEENLQLYFTIFFFFSSISEKNIYFYYKYVCLQSGLRAQTDAIIIIESGEKYNVEQETVLLRIMIISDVCQE